MTYDWVYNKSNTTGVTSGAGTTYPFRSTWVHPQFSVWFMLLNL